MKSSSEVKKTSVAVAPRVYPVPSDQDEAPSAVIQTASFPDLGASRAAKPVEAQAIADLIEPPETLALAESRRIREAARREAAALVNRAREEAARHSQAAFQEGLKRGETEGREEWRKQMTSPFSALGEAARRLAEFRETYRRYLDSQIPPLVILLTKKMIRRELLLEEGTIVGMVRGALARVVGGSEVTLRVSPSDYEVLNARKAELSVGLEEIKGIRFEADQSVAPGGCLVETPSGLVDARLETQLEEAALILEGKGDS
jgi:flagellar assembly protein FliH